MNNEIKLEHLQTLEIPQYLTKVKTSDSQRRKYYRKRKAKAGPRKGQLIWKPRKLTEKRKQKLKEGTWNVDSDGYLRNEDGDRIVANPRSAGTPNYEPVSGNRFSSGMHHRTRMTLIEGIKDFYRPFVQQMEPFTDFPIMVVWEFHTKIKEPNFDMSNFWFYYKYFEDTMVDEEIIPDDNVKYVTLPGAPLLVTHDQEGNPLEWEDRKFIFHFFHDQRESIQNDDLWNNH